MIAQLAATATELPQVFVCVKSALLVPVIAMPVMLNATLPLFVSLTVFVVLVPTSCGPQFKLVADRLTAGDWALAPARMSATRPEAQKRTSAMPL